jgi:hypothetical protein
MTEKVTERNTKREIMSAYNKSLETIKTLKAQKVGRGTEVTRDKNVATVQRATASSVKDIVQALADLRVGANETISNLEESILEKKSQLDDIQTAITLQKSELKNVHDVTVEADTLAALMEAQSDEKRTFQVEMDETRRGWEKEKSDRAERLNEQRAHETKEQKRRTDDFDYQFKLKQSRQDDELAEGRRLFTRELDKKREEVEKEFTERDEALTSREEEFNSYVEQVKSFPEKLEKAKEDAVASAMKSEKSSRHFEVSALKRDVTTANQIHENTITMLNEKVGALTEENAHLREQLNAANEKVQSVAVEAIKGAQAKIVQPQVVAGGSK